MAQVSRQAVSQWMKAATKENANVDVLSSHLKRLAEGLGVSADDLLNPLPVLDNPGNEKNLTALLLWDRLYPGLVEFCMALVRNEETALARLVEVFGLFRAAKIAGDRAIWGEFPKFKRRIRPGRRAQLESVWRICQA